MAIMNINIGIGAFERDEHTPYTTDPMDEPKRHRNAYERLRDDFGYRREDTPPNELRMVSDDITSDERGVNIRYQRVLTVRKEHEDGGSTFIARLFVNRRHAFTMHIAGGFSRACRVACGAALAWHRATGDGRRAE